MKIQQKMVRRNNIIDLKPISAAGGVIVSYEEDKQPNILLIYRRGVWDLPKGKKEDGESLKECAVREVVEEIGIHEDPTIIAELIKTYHEYKQGKTYFGKDTHWYAMQLSSTQVVFKPEREEGIEKVEWVPLPKAKKRVGYKNLVEVLESVFAKISKFQSD